jgi:hypothetical protein
LWEAPEDAGGRSWLVILVLLAIIGLYAAATASLYAGAHGGVDQNGYLMTARLIAGERNPDSPTAPYRPERADPRQNASAPATFAVESAPGSPSTSQAAVLSTAIGARMRPLHPAPPPVTTWPAFDWLRNRLSFVPTSPYQFAGRMCVMTEPFGPASTTQPAEYRLYAKYPFGFPLMAAMGRWIGGLDGMYVVNPACTVLACFMAYFLFRQAVAPFTSLLGVLWLACNPLVLNYANDANSHASTLFWVTLGAWGLVSWLRVGGFARAVVGGFALGYACTVRYSEFLLVLPVLCAAAIRFRFRWRQAGESLALVAAWAIPVGVLALVCWVCFGAPWKTGYSYCNESTGFAWKYLSGDMGDSMPGRQGNWETMLIQLNRTGLFLLWPLALAGLFGLVGSRWRLGVTLALWVVPPIVLYMLYYWAPALDTSMWYMRFILSVVPGMILAALWVLERGLAALRSERGAAIGMTALAAGGILVAAGFVADSEAPVVGGAFFQQAGLGVWHLFSGAHGWLVTAFATAIMGLPLAAWFLDRALLPARTALALGAGALTALGCAVNVNLMASTLESNHARWTALRETVDEVRQHLPRGAVLFAGSTRFDDSTLNQLDAVGGLELFSLSMFEQPSFADAKRRVDAADRALAGGAEPEPEPDPIQVERERFYMELLGKRTASGELVVRSAEELRQAQFALMDTLIARGKRIAFLSPDGSKGMFPVRAGYALKELARWSPPPAVPAPRVARQMAKTAPPRRPAAYTVLYELVKKSVPASASRPAKQQEGPGP